MKSSDANTEDSAPASRAVSHFVELVCLQGRLLIADLKEGAESAKLAAVFAVTSLLLLVAAAPTALIALAFFLRDRFDCSMALALFISALVAIAIGSLFGAAAWSMGRQGAATAVKSYDDFEANVRSLTRSSS